MGARLVPHPPRPLPITRHDGAVEPAPHCCRCTHLTLTKICMVRIGFSVFLVFFYLGARPGKQTVARAVRAGAGFFEIVASTAMTDDPSSGGGSFDAGRANMIESVAISSCVTKYEDEDKKKKK
jgi:hypothetical protein